MTWHSSLDTQKGSAEEAVYLSNTALDIPFICEKHQERKRTGGCSLADKLLAPRMYSRRQKASVKEVIYPLQRWLRLWISDEESRLSVSHTDSTANTGCGVHGSIRAGQDGETRGLEV
jgi:hypothetical protein